MIKYLTTVFCIFFSINVFAESPKHLIDFINSYETGHYHPKFEDKEGLLLDDLDGVKVLIDQVAEEIDSGSTDPGIYWLRPVLQSIQLVMYRTHHKDKFITLYGTNDNHQPRTIKMLRQTSMDYEEALLLNKDASDNIKLNEDMINRIVTSQYLPARVLEMANQERLVILEKGDIENEEELYEDIYSRMINSYLMEKDYDNALRILKEYYSIYPGMLTEHLPSLESQKEIWEEAARHQTEAVTHQIETTPNQQETTTQQVEATPQQVEATPQQVEATPQQVEAEKQEKITRSTESTKPELATSGVNQPPVVEVNDSRQKDLVHQESSNNRIMVIAIVLVVLLLVGFVIVRRAD